MRIGVSDDLFCDDFFEDVGQGRKECYGTVVIYYIYIDSYYVCGIFFRFWDKDDCTKFPGGREVVNVKAGVE